MLRSALGLAACGYGFESRHTGTRVCYQKPHCSISKGGVPLEEFGSWGYDPYRGAALGPMHLLLWRERSRGGNKKKIYSLGIPYFLGEKLSL